jgi:hypothetical protein
MKSIRCGGRGGIRTHEGLAPLAVFKFTTPSSFVFRSPLQSGAISLICGQFFLFFCFRVLRSIGVFCSEMLPLCCPSGDLFVV